MLLEVVVTVSVSVSLAAPVPMPARLIVCWLASSLMVRLLTLFNVGAWFTGVTVTVKVSVAVVPAESVTVTVMVDEPNCVAAGVTFTFRFAPEPVKSMLAFGMSVGLEEVPEIVRLEAAVSTSPTVKGRVEVALPSATVWFAISEIVGRSLTLVTVTVNVRAKESF